MSKLRMKLNCAYIFVTTTLLTGTSLANWHEWWTYDGISGPSYWGVINPAWTMCNKGRQQSPVDISPAQLVYDSRYTRLIDSF